MVQYDIIEKMHRFYPTFPSQTRNHTTNQNSWLRHCLWISGIACHSL